MIYTINNGVYRQCLDIIKINNGSETYLDSLKSKESEIKSLWDSVKWTGQPIIQAATCRLFSGISKSNFDYFDFDSGFFTYSANYLSAWNFSKCLFTIFLRAGSYKFTLATQNSSGDCQGFGIYNKSGSLNTDLQKRGSYAGSTVLQLTKDDFIGIEAKTFNWQMKITIKQTA